MMRTMAKKLPSPVKIQIKKLMNLRRRRAIAMGYYSKKLAMIDKWVWRDTETSNFYYKLTRLIEII